MNLHCLEYFIALEQTGNMTRAAEMLYVSQSNISQFLASEEKKIGKPIFSRVNGKYVPTEIGRVYIDYAKQMLELKRQFDTRLSALASPETIRIGYTSSTASKMLEQISPSFQALHPGSKVNSLDVSNLDTAIHFLANGKLDLAFVTTHSKHLYDGPTKILAKEEIFLGVPASHPVCSLFEGSAHPRLSAHKIIQLFGDSTFILPSEGSCIRRLVDDFFAAASCTYTDALYAASVFTIADMIACGLGVGFVPAICLTPPNPAIRYFSLTPKIYRLHAIYRRSDGSSDLLNDLVRFAVHYYKNIYSSKSPKSSPAEGPC